METRKQSVNTEKLSVAIKHEMKCAAEMSLRGWPDDANWHRKVALRGIKILRLCAPAKKPNVELKHGAKNQNA